MKNYEIIEHTADIGIRLRARDLSSLFKNAAIAMFDIIGQGKKPATKLIKMNVNQRADDVEQLFVNWLNELLSLSSAEGLLFYNFEIANIDNNNIEAVAAGYEIGNTKLQTEIKAATYHELKVEKIGDNWQAQVIFDV